MKVFDTIVRTETMEPERVDSVVNSIVEILAGVCDKAEKYIHKFSYGDGKAVMLTTRCSQQDYDRFVNAVEMVYPDLCEFNFKLR